MTITPMPVLRKPTATIQIANPFGFGVRKLLNTLMFHAQCSGSALGVEHEISLAEVSASLGWAKGKSHDTLREYLEILMTTLISWNGFGDDRRESWEACQFLSFGGIRNGKLRYVVNPAIADKLADPVLYAKVQLLVQGHLSRGHTLGMYELCEDALGRRVDLSAVPIERLCTLLGLTGATHRQYKYLRRNVLSPSIDELNRHSDLQVKFWGVTLAGSRAISAVGFDVERKPGPCPGPVTAEEPAVEEDGGREAERQLVDRLAEAGIDGTAARRLVARHGQELVAGRLLHLEREIRRGTSIRSPGAWLRRAIEQEWSAPEEDRDGQRDGTRPEAAGREATSPAGRGSAGGAPTRDRPADDPEELAGAFFRHRNRAAREAFAKRSKTFVTRHRNAFTRRMEVEGNTAVLGALRTGGWDSPMVCAMFFSDQKLLDSVLEAPHEKDITAYELWRRETSR